MRMVALWLSLAIALPAADANDLAGLFAYPSTDPLNFQIHERETVNGVEVLSVSFNGGRAPVSATLVAPMQSGRHPAVIFMSDAGHRRDYFVAEAVALANARPPALSLLMDAPPARPPGWRRTFNAMLEDNDRDIYIQSVIDVRRAIDLLAARPDVDPRSLAYVGLSDAARWGAVLSGVESRLRALVLIAGSPNLTKAQIEEDPEWADLRYGMGTERFQKYLDSLSAIDPMRYLSPTGPPILFQFGRFDPFVPRPSADALWHASGGKGQARFYVSGHEVNDPEALFDRAGFLAARIGIGKMPCYCGKGTPGTLRKSLN